TGDEATGAQMVRVACDAPLRQIAINAGLEGGVVVEKVRTLEPGHGLNAATGEYVDMVAAGIIDPAKVTRSALQNAASIAALFLTTEAVVADKPEKEKATAGAPGGGDMDFWSPLRPYPVAGQRTAPGRCSQGPFACRRCAVRGSGPWSATTCWSSAVRPAPD